MRKQLLYYSMKYSGNYQEIEQAVLRNEPYEDITCKDKFVTILDEEYPKQLLRLQQPPFVLYYIGDLSLCKKSCIAVVGSRECSSYGIEAATYVVNHLYKKHTIVSGLAKGIDAIAHSTAKRSIGVIAGGLDSTYPACNDELYQKVKEYGLLLSEYPRGTKPLAHHFLLRNRIVVGLSNSLIVVEAKMRSGTQRSVQEALLIGLPIYAIPHSIFSKSGVGCNSLIAQGASILATYEDLCSLSESS